MYREGKEDRSWKKEEALREGKTINGAKYFPNFIHAPIPTDMILFTPFLLPNKVISSGSNVQCSISSSTSQYLFKSTPHRNNMTREQDAPTVVLCQKNNGNAQP
ncbi:hypothetical protein [Okeania sp. SIO1I7]|uniref:hypothetical protein n=1 Tax=Okeania sp. SIO1I7 TaxID=2607772 RepID=UPI0013F94CD6|nr:hypothetical protein [Okeania sp. SIO1I7]NET28926.1 hypothetical protein [Okeania sp. SIO1I7]